MTKIQHYFKILNCIRYKLKQPLSGTILLFIAISPLILSVIYKPVSQFNAFSDSNYDLISTPLVSQDFFQTDDVYIEQIKPEILGTEGIVHHALLSTNPGFLTGIDLATPIFDGCSMIFCLSNGKNTPINPAFSEVSQYSPLSESANFEGILYLELAELSYDPNYVETQIQQQMEEFFGMQVIFLSEIATQSSLLIPFTSMEISVHNQIRLLKKNMQNVPIDGYFSHLDSQIDNLLSNQRIQEEFFKENFIFLQNAGLVTEIEDLLLESLKNSSLSSSFSTISKIIPILQSNPVWESISNIKNTYTFPKDIDTLGDSNENSVDISSYMADFDLNYILTFIDQLQNIVLFEFMHEIADNSVKISPTGTYSLKIFDSFYFDNNTFIKTSEQSYSSILGLLSGISLSLISAEIVNISQNLFEIDEQNVMPFDFFLFISDFDPLYRTFLDFRLRSVFLSKGAVSDLIFWPEFTQKSKENSVNLLQYLIPFGLPALSGILMGEIPNFEISFSNIQLTPSLRVTKSITTTEEGYSAIDVDDLPLCSFNGNSNIVNFTINLINTGNTDIWGVPITNLDLYGINNVAQQGLINNAVLALGYDPVQMFSPEYPRYFPIDPFGAGIYQGFHPKINNLSLIYPYSPEYTQAILGNLGEIVNKSGYEMDYVIDYANNYNDSTSIYNPANWKISPQSNISIAFSQKLIMVDSDIFRKNSSNDTLFTFEDLRPAKVRTSTENCHEFRIVSSNSLSLLTKHNLFENDGQSLDNISIISLFETKASLNSSVGNINQKIRYTMQLSMIGTPISGDLKVKFPKYGVAQTITVDESYVITNKQKNYQLYLRNLTFNSSDLLIYSDFYSPRTMQLSPIEFIFGNLTLYESNDHIKLDCNAVLNSEISIIYVPFELETIEDHQNHLILEIVASTKIPPNQMTYRLGEIFEVTYTYRNLGLLPLNDFGLDLQERNMNMRGFKVVNHSMEFPMDGYFKTNETTKIRLVFQVEDISNNLIPLIVPTCSNAEFLIIKISANKIIGNSSVEISKLLKKTTGNFGILYTITVKLRNSGNATISSIIIDESNSYNMDDFRLFSGTLYLKSKNFQIGDEIEFNYQIQAQKIGKYCFNSAKIFYMFGEAIYTSSESLSGYVFFTKTSMFVFSFSLFSCISVFIFIYISKMKRGRK